MLNKATDIYKKNYIEEAVYESVNTKKVSEKVENGEDKDNL